jgi:thiamine-phosphate pyrophosphorylase
VRAGQAVLRLIDANANRALEGLRVCEEVVRFSVGTPALFRRLRALRHDTARAVQTLAIPRMALLRARDSRQDIGRGARASRIPSLERLAVINLQRVKESLRTLEECSRLAAPRRVQAFQRLRFRVYEVERDLLLALEILRHR